MRAEPSRALADLRALRELTEDEDGAQRLCWTDTWAEARRWFDSRLEGLDVEVETDAAGNKWVTLAGERPEALVVGSHIDSVPDGGWLDGALGLLGGLEVLRAAAAAGRPPLTLKLVDWADEEGARFGYGLLGSSAVSGCLDVEKAPRADRPRGPRAPRRARRPRGAGRPDDRRPREPGRRRSATSSCTSSRAPCSRTWASRSRW